MVCSRNSEIAGVYGVSGYALKVKKCMGALEIHNELLTEMVQRGIVFGHRKSKTHPKMRPFVSANRNEIDLLDPEATLVHLEKAIVFLREVVQKGGLALLVGTMP